MKKSYLKIIIFSFISILLFMINSFVLKSLNKYILCLFILVYLIVIKFTLGYEKDRHRFCKDAIIEIVIILLLFFIFYYLSGLIISFSKTGNYLNFTSIKNIILPTVIYIVLREFLRYALITKTSESKKMLFIVYLFFLFMDLTISLSYNKIDLSQASFLYIALSVLPAISENILCNWIVLKYGYKPSLFYCLVMTLYPYILPIIPNPNQYIYSLLFFGFPIIVLLRLFNLKTDLSEEEYLERDYNKKKSIIAYIPIALFVSLLIYFVSGYFRYYSVAIATGSMVPNINVGDVAIIDQKYNIKQLEIGDVIAYNYNEKIIVHRIINILKVDKEYYIYTQGDANSSPDECKITKDMIVGVVNHKVPYIGYPTVIVNRIWSN